MIGNFNVSWVILDGHIFVTSLHCEVLAICCSKDRSIGLSTVIFKVFSYILVVLHYYIPTILVVQWKALWTKYNTEAYNTIFCHILKWLYTTESLKLPEGKLVPWLGENGLFKWLTFSSFRDKKKAYINYQLNIWSSGFCKKKKSEWGGDTPDMVPKSRKFSLWCQMEPLTATSSESLPNKQRNQMAQMQICWVITVISKFPYK